MDGFDRDERAVFFVCAVCSSTRVSKGSVVVTSVLCPADDFFFQTSYLAFLPSSLPSFLPAFLPCFLPSLRCLLCRVLVVLNLPGAYVFCFCFSRVLAFFFRFFVAPRWFFSTSRRSPSCRPTTVSPVRFTLPRNVGKPHTHADQEYSA